MLKQILPSIFQISQANTLRQTTRSLFVSATNEAARKGTREKARKKKVKVEIKKVGFIPHNLRTKVKVETNKHFSNRKSALPIDNVYFRKFYKIPKFSFSEVIQFHREVLHPTMFNVPNAPVIAKIELNMQAEKITRFVDNFSRMVHIDHNFQHGEERSILVFAKGIELIEEANKAGATLAGEGGLIRSIQNGDLKLNDFQYVIAHNNILAELVPIRGLMKKKFPNPKTGTLGNNITEMVQKFMNGITYKVTKDENQKDYACTEIQIGTLDMPTEHLESNFKNLLVDIDTMRPRRDGKFITIANIMSPPSKECLQVDPFVYVAAERAVTSKKGAREEIEEEIEDDEEEKKAEALN